MMKIFTKMSLILMIAFSSLAIACTPTAKPMAFKNSSKWVLYEGAKGKAGSGKHIVLISGDEEYRSEEAMPQLGKILSQQHGFHCAVLFSQGEDGFIDPMNQKNIPGLENLAQADLMMIFTRFRNLPDAQMKFIDDYLKTGNPVIGMRTATHAFNMAKKSSYHHYTFNYKGDKKEWLKGFGKFILGETWVSHHGHHKVESCLGLIAKGAEKHPIWNGIKEGDIWGDADVYGIRLPLPGDSQHIVMGQVLKGMNQDDGPAVPAERKGRYKNKDGNNPMMPVSWVKSYQIPEGKKGKVFNTTMGAATDLVVEGTRRMLVNAVYWVQGMEVPTGGTSVDIVGEFKPSKYSSSYGKKVHGMKITPSSHELKK